MTPPPPAPPPHPRGRRPGDRDALRRRVLFLLVPGIACIVLAIAVAVWFAR